jgi:hypothetical protein
MGEPYFIEHRHSRLRSESQEGRKRDVGAIAACRVASRNDGLLGRNVVRGHVFDGDLLLATASVVVKPFS